MTEKRRERGEGALYWSESRNRWVAEVSAGYNGRGQRISKVRSARTKTEARRLLKDLLRQVADGLHIDSDRYTVSQAAHDWLEGGVTDVSAATKTKLTNHVAVHIVPELGALKLRDLRPRHVDTWLAKIARDHATSTVQRLRGVLVRILDFAMRRDQVARNVARVCIAPRGTDGRPSKSLSHQQAAAILKLYKQHPIGPYIAVSMLTGARTEEVRELRWDHVHLTSTEREGEKLPPHMWVWRSVREGGDTKTKKSRRSIALSDLCRDALLTQRTQQRKWKMAAGDRWEDHGLVFTTRIGTGLDSANARRSFRQALRQVDGIDPREWTPRELRHSFVSLLSDSGMPIEEISRLVGHSGTAVTELVYRKQLRPVIQSGATTMDRLFPK